MTKTRIRMAQSSENPGLAYEQTRSLWLHRAVIEEMALDPERTMRIARENIERWRSVHRPDGMAVRCLDQWSGLLNQGVEAVIEILTSTHECSINLRQNTPFAGVISEEQRRRILEAFREHWNSGERRQEKP